MSTPAARRLMATSADGVRALFFLIFLLVMVPPGRARKAGAHDKITFLNGIAQGVTTTKCATLPGPCFFTGSRTPKSIRPLHPGPTSLVAQPSFSSKRWGSAREGFFGALAALPSRPEPCPCDEARAPAP